MFKKILIALFVLFVVIQFIRPAKNLTGEKTQDITTKYQVSNNVETILQKACNDCHSNKTEYPWYAEIQPVGWWLNHHIEEGKRHFNVNTFASYPAAVQKKRFEDLIEQMQHDEMPLTSYTIIHTNAKLTEAEKQALIDWSNAGIDSLKARYPADSLVLKRRPRG